MAPNGLELHKEHLNQHCPTFIFLCPGTRWKFRTSCASHSPAAATQERHCAPKKPLCSMQSPSVTQATCAAPAQQTQCFLLLMNSSGAGCEPPAPQKTTFPSGKSPGNMTTTIFLLHYRGLLQSTLILKEMATWMFYQKKNPVFISEFLMRNSWD